MGLPIDLSGQRFGKWSVLQRTGGRHWVRCDCGVEKKILSASLKTGMSTSCGACGNRRGPRPNTADSSVAGRTFSRLTAIRPTDKRESNSIVWECICVCGTVCLASQRVLVQGSKRSCGCLRPVKKEKIPKPSRTRNLVGMCSGMLKFLRDAKRGEDSDRRIVCQCKCGVAEVTIRASNFLDGRTKTCGCVNSIPPQGRTRYILDNSWNQT